MVKYKSRNYVKIIPNWICFVLLYSKEVRIDYCDTWLGEKCVKTRFVVKIVRSVVVATDWGRYFSKQ